MSGMKLPMAPYCIRLLVTCVMLFSLGTADAAEDAAKVFDEVYGKSLRQVQATPSFADDIELASSLVEAAKTTTDQPQLFELLGDQAFKLAAADPAGLRVAAAATELESSHIPAKKRDLQARLVDAIQRLLPRLRGDEKKELTEKLITTLTEFAEADAAENDFTAAAAQYRHALAAAAGINSPSRERIQSALADIATRQQVLSRIEAAKTKLKANPADTAAGTELVRLYVVDLDDPAGAQLYTFLIGDEAWKTNIKLAVIDAKDLTGEQCMTMGDWYRSLAEGKSPAIQMPLLTRSLAYYKQFRANHNADDLAAKKAELAARDVNAALIALATRIPPRTTAGVAVTLHWNIADDADVYLNGKPLNDTSTSFRKRPDEAYKKSRADVVLRKGDIITVGGHRGGSYGFWLVALSKNGDTVLRTDATTWKAYKPEDIENWFQPAVALKSKTTTPCTNPSPWHIQVTMASELKVKADSIWLTPESRHAFFYTVIR